MASAPSRRIARLEQGRAAIVPNVVEVATVETDEQAVARFIAQHGRAPSSCIVVPARAAEEELPECETAWADQQRRLIGAAKSQSKKEEPNVERYARIRSIQHAASGDRLHSGHRTPVATRRMGWQGGAVQG
ncbi:hypothetical protein SFOMI_1733 [Sphingobium fuliginis]|uniref:Uncharacterized protein n=1 Tax=Sphingobium fuliginis (strain ATCC 27551) TaxID=336203 RepID=A0A292ZDI9_SPHSA|nr:hypothetical protein SFOMI_1733 [Sphingobium fuliginis]